MSKTIYLEGGGSKEVDIRCREGFGKLLERCGFKGRMPKLVPSGGRDVAFKDFQTAHACKKASDYVAMLIDSEDPPTDAEAPWDHLKQRDGWEKPIGAKDDQVLLMITCMETWIIADREVLARHYGEDLQVTALSSQVDLESRDRTFVQERLARASRNCSNAYLKGKRSFEVLGKLNPDVLEEHLGAFKRMRRILKKKL